MAAAAGILGLILLLLSIAVGIASFVCFVLVVIEMFKRNETGIGIATIVLSVCTGLGPLLAFIYGWVKSSEWGLKKVMLAWTVLFVANIFLVVRYIVFFVAAAAPQIQQQMEQNMRNAQQMRQDMIKQQEQVQPEMLKQGEAEDDQEP